MKKIIISKELIQEGKNIVDGIYFPLNGFLKQKDLSSVLENMRLENGKVWTMPIVLDIDEKTKKRIASEEEIQLTNSKGEVIFLLKRISIYKLNREHFIKNLFGTNDKAHPGAARALKMKDFLVGGELELVKRLKEPHRLFYTPKETREIFKKNGWANVVAFQTRNPPQRSHEYLQKTALAEVDGLFVNPVIGRKKKGDFKDIHIIGAYKVLIEKYYPINKVVLGTLHTFMRYAGPKEAVFHALVRRNFGCTHMIIGRDHAGVGSYYGTYDAQKIFDNFSQKELGITILKYENAIFCKGCKNVIFEGQCNKHNEEEKISLSGTKLREKLQKNEGISEGFMRKEVARYLMNQKDIFI